ncbi:glutamate decarboxylase gad1 [Entomophthora muscae]|uniref:Glutamate decarboxylase gad1 n=1 Tax=Entomophthora muscae TaxID=34485 RepID=A0ACC2T329_9FUNG|nr:glutamate decarboxylase gad1 [Entomophthora muscae]
MLDSTSKKINASIEALKGALQETAGWAQGNEELQAKGIATRDKADEEHMEELKQGYRDGMKLSIAGCVKENLGALMGDKKVQADGKDVQAKGEAIKKANSKALHPN